jgi:hypothetical protein
MERSLYAHLFLRKPIWKFRASLSTLHDPVKEDDSLFASLHAFRLVLISMCVDVLMDRCSESPDFPLHLASRQAPAEGGDDLHGPSLIPLPSRLIFKCLPISNKISFFALSDWAPPCFSRVRQKTTTWSFRHCSEASSQLPARARAL